MPPPRIATLAREPRLSMPPAVKKSGTFTSGLAGSFGGIGFFPGSTGTPVTPWTALSSAPVYACVKRISEDVGKLPIRIMRRLRPRGWRVDTDHPLNNLFRKPNQLQTSSQMIGYLTWCLALRGNGYAAILRGRAGEPLGLLPINPDRTSPLLGQDGLLYYQISHQLLGASSMRLHQDNVIHPKGMTLDGYVGVSPITLAQDPVGLALAAQTHGAVTFRQGAQLSGVLMHPGTLGNDARADVGRDFDANFAGLQNVGRTVVLEEGMKFEKVQMTNEDAQFLETRRFSVLEICRLFGVPPHKVMDLGDSHYNNVEQTEQMYINDTLDPITNQICELLEDRLLFDDERDNYRIRFDFKALTRGDRKTRAEVYGMGIRDRWMNPNDARVEEDMEPEEGLDEFLTPLNMTGDAKPKPAPVAEDAT